MSTRARTDLQNQDQTNADGRRWNQSRCAAREPRPRPWQGQATLPRALRGPAMLPLGLAFLLGGACQQQEKSPIDKGRATYSRACASCHAVPAGNQTRLGFKVPPPNLAEAKLQARLSDAQIRKVIREGKGQMPPFGKMLPDSEVDDLLVYLRSLPQAKPAPP